MRIEGALFASATNRPGGQAIVDGERKCTYDELARVVCGLAAELRGKGLLPGERVGVFFDKSLEAVVALYGTWAAGGVVVPINEGLRSTQIAHILGDSGARLLLSTPRKLAGIEASAYEAVATADVDLVALAGSSAAAPEDLPSGAREPAAILYTSGSTGLPKGILISHANLLAGTRIVVKYLELQPDERILSVLPFSFDYGLNQLLTAVDRGATLVLQRSHFPPDICRALESHQITGLAGVPTLWIQLMQRHSPFSQRSFPALRYITNSGGVFPVELVRRYREHLPHTRIYLMYGLSEAFRSTYLPPAEVDRRTASMGKAIPETEILVVDEAGKQCGAEEIGELVHAGPTVSLGYWNRPDSTAAVFRPDPRRPDGDGPRVVYSGDLVKRDAEGFLTFVGRRDQQIKSHGFRISPEEVEEALHRSGLLAEVIVRGIPDDVAGMAIEAHVVPRVPDGFSLDALRRYCEGEMPRYMLPKTFVVHASLPRTSSGKVDRKNVGKSASP